MSIKLVVHVVGITGISEASKRAQFFPLPPSEASKCVPIFDRGTRTKLQGSDPAAWSRA